MKTAILYTVELLVEQDGHHDICSDLLTEEMQKYCGAQSGLIDWRIKDPVRFVVLDDNYEPGESPWPYAGEQTNEETP